MKATTPGGTFKAAPGGVKVRMYRQGFGDCFLLAFGGENGAQTYVMIDMGVVYAAADKPATMKKIATSIHAATGGHVDVLVITHEHYDHVCGFEFAKDELSKITFGQAWLAWTQDPRDNLAKSLHDEFGQELAALEQAAMKLKAGADDRGAERLRQHLTFHGELLGASEKFSPTTKKALETGRGLAGKSEYWKPGAVIDDVIEGVRVYVLGPPRSKEKLKETEPAPGEVYLAERAALAGFVAALAGGAGVGESSRPFDAAYAIPERAGAKHPFLAHSYFGRHMGSDQARKERYDWRRIDASWLRVGEALALQMQNATNNTSLVLAFEMVDSGRVLLFPGDAQPGNWRSWKDVKFPVRGGRLGRDGVVASDDLLAATVVYKVGHHGSHNGTLKGEGLEKMTSRDLIALLPTSKAHAVKSGWDKIPKRDLVERLLERAEGRVLSADPATKAPDRDRPPSEAPSRKAWAAFVSRVSEPEGDLCFDVEV
ncbi:MAG: hypothetical protein JNL50_09500 [Phycisphaerae bacterium]|nr:hypothetical protein [Phycisphaerae bacterium]